MRFSDFYNVPIIAGLCSDVADGAFEISAQSGVDKHGAVADLEPGETDIFLLSRQRFLTALLLNFQLILVYLLVHCCGRHVVKAYLIYQ